VTPQAVLSNELGTGRAAADDPPIGTIKIHIPVRSALKPSPHPPRNDG
jgi:hypothetical protein